ncbi:MAG: hypothetical protein EOO74_05895 [Myxococcales bacterium]|nr:MAG: hypothetical protein EOO74_05895 [Myxococcales bacterium]
MRFTDTVHPSIESLADRLRVDAGQLDMLADCDEADLARFDSLVAAVIEREDAAVAQGVTDSLRFLPGPLKAVVKKALFGGKR